MYLFPAKRLIGTKGIFIFPSESHYGRMKHHIKFWNSNFSRVSNSSESASLLKIIGESAVIHAINFQVKVWEDRVNTENATQVKTET